MATNVFSGRSGKLYHGTSSAQSTLFGAMRSFELTVTRPSIEVVHQDTSGWVQVLPGNASARLTAETVFLSTAATNGQDDLRQFLSSESRKYFKAMNSTAAGAQQWSGPGYVTNWTLGGDINSPQMHNFEITFDGKITEA